MTHPLMNNKNFVKILLADDDSVDRELFIDAMEDAGLPFRVDEVKNGVEVMEYLESCQDFPDLIFLDLNMPVVNGLEALLKIKQSPRLRVIPVFILSTSSSQHDIFQTYEAGANLFLVKPSNYERLVHTLRNLLELYKPSMAVAELI